MRRDERLRGLSSDHHHALALVQRIRRGADQAGVDSVVEIAAEVVRRFAKELDPHFRIEEELLLPELMLSPQMALAERTLAEHRQIRAQVADVEAGAISALHALADLLEAHVRFEERELFPACEVLVSDPALAEVARRVPHDR